MLLLTLSLNNNKNFVLNQQYYSPRLTKYNTIIVH